MKKGKFVLSLDYWAAYGEQITKQLNLKNLQKVEGEKNIEISGESDFFTADGSEYTFHAKVRGNVFTLVKIQARDTGEVVKVYK